MLLRYADGSPDFRIDVHVFVIVKHMAMAKMFWRSRMKGHYSPNLWRESTIFRDGESHSYVLHGKSVHSSTTRAVRCSKKEMNQSHSGTHLTICEGLFALGIEQY